MVDRAAARDPRRDVGAARMNLMRWQLAGAGQVCPLVWASIAVSGTTPSVAAHGSAWQGAAPTVTRSSQGIYVVQWAATYADDGGVQVATNLLAALVSVKKGSLRLQADWAISAGRTVTVELVDKTDAVQDPAGFLLACW